MQKYTNDVEVRYFDDDVDVSIYIDLNIYRLITEDEADRFENPEKYLSAEEKLHLFRERLPLFSPVEFELMLDANGLYDAVQDVIATNRTIKAYYTRSINFNRLDSLLDQLRIALGLTDEQVDEMWEHALTL